MRFMKLTTPFTILNLKSNKLNLIRDAIKERRVASEKLHEDYRKMYKNHQFAYQFLMEFLNMLWHNQPNTVIGLGLAMLVILGIYIKLLDIYQ